MFSTISIDHAHEQNNVHIKEDGGAVGLTDNPSTLQRWMIAGPEVARAIAEFQTGHEHWERWVDTSWRPNTKCANSVHQRCLLSCCDVELGNPFEEESMDLVVLDTKEMADLCNWISQKCLKDWRRQFQVFTKECLVERTKSIYDAIHRNKLKVFSISSPSSVSKGKQQVASLQNDLQLFSRLYISCQTWDENLE